MKIAVISIAIVILAVVLYAIFAKSSTTTQSGGGGSTEVHQGALGWLKGLLSGLNLSVVGAGG